MIRIYLTVILLIAGSITLYYGNSMLIDHKMENWLRQREIVHIQAVRTFKNRVERFASVVSGLRSYMINADELPDDRAMQDFLNHQVKYLNFKDSLIISYLDLEHNFIYSISNNEIDPSGLVGTNVRDYRDEDAIRRLEELMEDEKLHLYKPLNLIEGWVGISLNFSIKREGETHGYMLAIVNFNSIIRDVYDPQFIGEFCHHFTTSEGLDFDRERVYDDSKVYHERYDPEYYKNFDIPEENFIYSDIKLFDKEFRIGTSYKEPFKPGIWIPVLSAAWYLIFVGVVLYILRQSKILKDLNLELIRTNNEVEKQKNKIESKNLQLVEANAAKDKFFSIIGHDLKSPLRSIQTLVSLRKDKVISPDETDIFWEDLIQLNNKTINLLDDLLEWASINTERKKTHFQKISLNTIIRDIVELNHGATTLKHISVKPELEDHLDMIGDANMIAGILRNLIINAIKFTHKNGTITIKGVHEGDVIALSIADNGVGMSTNELKEIFRLDKEMPSKGTDGETGTGLGLIICKEYVNLHHGKIWAESVESQGSTFFVTLPKNHVNVS